jgi:hypothetical protein
VGRPQGRAVTLGVVQVGERESDFRYTPTTCFESFPFPDPTARLRTPPSFSTNAIKPAPKVEPGR